MTGIVVEACPARPVAGSRAVAVVRAARTLLPYFVPFALASLVVAARAPVPSDWRYLGQGALIMFGGGEHGGLHTYASFTQLQIGPLSFGVARTLIAVNAPHAAFLTSATILALLPAVLWLSERAVAATGRPVTRRQLVVIGLVAAPVWAELALRHHLDDALVVTAIAAVAWALATGRAVGAVVLVVAGCAAKPWAVVALPMLLALPRRRWHAFAAGAGASLLVYLPFLVADPGTLHAGRPNVLVSGSSLLRLAGFPVGVIPSAGLRVAQLVVAVGLGVWLVRRSPAGWLALPVACVATRLLLDPGTFAYYVAGLTGGAVLLDLRLSRRAPLLTPLSVALWALAYAAPSLGTALLRTLLLVAVVALSLAVSDGRKRRWEMT